MQVSLVLKSGKMVPPHPTTLAQMQTVCDNHGGPCSQTSTNGYHMNRSNHFASSHTGDNM